MAGRGLPLPGIHGRGVGGGGGGVGGGGRPTFLLIDDMASGAEGRTATTVARAIAGHNDAGEAGFTLVELLVGLALFSLLATLLFGNVRFGLQAWQRSCRAIPTRFDRAGPAAAADWQYLSHVRAGWGKPAARF